MHKISALLSLLPILVVLLAANLPIAARAECDPALQSPKEVLPAGYFEQWKAIQEKLILADDEGTSTGRGGMGMACFSTENEAIRALDPKSGKVKPELRDSITRVWSLDFAASARDWMAAPKDGEAPRDYIRRVIAENLAPGHPIFAKRLSEAHELLDRAEWTNAGSLPLIPDNPAITALATNGRREPVEKPDERKCVPVQIIRRVNQFEHGRLKSVRFEYDADLYQKLRSTMPGRYGILNEASIRMHEAIYLLAEAQGAPNYFKLGTMTFELLMDKEKTPYAAPGVTLFRVLSLANADKYQRPLFDAPSGFPQHVEAQKKRAASWETYRKLLRGEVEAVVHDPEQAGIVARSGLASTLLPKYAESLLNPAQKAELVARFTDNLWPQLTPEQAFLDVAVFGYSQKAVTEFDALITPGEDPTRAVQETCNFVFSSESLAHRMRIPVHPLVLKAKDYCVK
ncbi:MAG: hypothetical protein NDJ90_08045 [Oligoflexia bacterium]|nr:hypothetical protein [Oligoflexia bacterium]